MTWSPPHRNPFVKKRGAEVTGLDQKVDAPSE
jgi:hypothetical protein